MSTGTLILGVHDAMNLTLFEKGEESNSTRRRRVRGINLYLFTLLKAKSEFSSSRSDCKGESLLSTSGRVPLVFFAVHRLIALCCPSCCLSPTAVRPFIRIMPNQGLCHPPTAFSLSFRRKSSILCSLPRSGLLKSLTFR
jgi:hypothetical protein